MPTTDQIRAARALLGLSQPQLAQAAGMSTMTLKRAEGVARPPASETAMKRLAEALEAAGVIFLSENGDGPGVRLRKTKAAPSGPKGPATDAVQSMGAAIQMHEERAAKAPRNKRGVEGAPPRKPRS